MHGLTEPALLGCVLARIGASFALTHPCVAAQVNPQARAASEAC
jgi:hypothetical protein